MAKSKASDLVNGTIEIGDNLLIDDRFRIGGAEWLEDQKGIGFVEFVEKLGDVPSIKDIRLILTALAKQKNPDMPEAEIVKALYALELTDIQGLFGQLKILDFEEKNFQTPESTEVKLMET